MLPLMVGKLFLFRFISTKYFIIASIKFAWNKMRQAYYIKIAETLDKGYKK